jgi:S-adenosylmethionine-dependent methyltransferase
MNSWETSEGALALAYAGHSDGLRGAVRHALVHRAIVAAVPEPTRVLDIGGGTAIQARMLARRGYEVTVIDPDPRMHEQATAALADEPDDVRHRVRLVSGSGEQAVDLVGDSWDVVCCHGVLMYLDDPLTLLAELVRATAGGGTISVLTKNAAALPLRPALEGRWADALALLDANTETGNLGIASRGHDRHELSSQLEALGASVTDWYGVRVATDHLRDTPAAPNQDLAIDLEWELGRRDPYRACGRLLHLVARRNTTAS